MSHLIPATFLITMLIVALYGMLDFYLEEEMKALQDLRLDYPEPSPAYEQTMAITEPYPLEG